MAKNVDFYRLPINKQSRFIHRTVPTYMSVDKHYGIKYNARRSYLTLAPAYEFVSKLYIHLGHGNRSRAPSLS